VGVQEHPLNTHTTPDWRREVCVEGKVEGVMVQLLLTPHIPRAAVHRSLCNWDMGVRVLVLRQVGVEEEGVT